MSKNKQKITLEIELPEDFEPFTYGCADSCPFGYVDWEENQATCCYDETTCPVLKAIKRDGRNFK